MRILHLDREALFQPAIFPPQYFIKKQKCEKNTVGKTPKYIICSNSLECVSKQTNKRFLNLCCSSCFSILHSVSPPSNLESSASKHIVCYCIYSLNFKVQSVSPLVCAWTLNRGEYSINGIKQNCVCKQTEIVFLQQNCHR